MFQDDLSGQTIELGCNWIEGLPLDENPLWAIAQKIDLKGHTTNVDDPLIMFDKSGKVNMDIVSKILARMDATIAAAYKESNRRQFYNLPDISLRDAFTDAGW